MLEIESAETDNAVVRHATLIDELRNSADVEHGANNGDFMSRSIENGPNCNETRIARIDKGSSRRGVVSLCPIANQCRSNI